MLAADNWCVKVEDRVYGPYSSVQLRKYAQEGRFAAWSQVAPAGSRDWREAEEEPTFAGFFGMPARAAAHPRPSFGKRNDGPIEIGETLAELADGAGASPAPFRPLADRASTANTGLANFVIIFDVVNAAASRIETAVLSLGPGFRIAENVWAVSCELTAIGVRNALAPYLLPRESIFVVDATRGRTSWQNYTPETHAKLAAAWSTAKA
jgi:hypothetical protein